VTVGKLFKGDPYNMVCYTLHSCPFVSLILTSLPSQGAIFPWRLLSVSSSPEEEESYSFLSSTPAKLFLSILGILSISLYLARLIYQDYQFFLSLGPGGTPPTPLGYMRICLLRLVKLRDPLNPPVLDPGLHPQEGLLSAKENPLPIRKGEEGRRRPQVAGLAPQRQLTQRSGKEIYQRLSDAIHRLVQQHPDRLYLDTSCFEKHSTGLAAYPAYRKHATCNGEICHAHPCDGSVHLTLHPADVKVVIERGWGERHPLAWDRGWWAGKIVPPGFVMVYAPRDEKEVACVMQIIRAAVWWVSGTDLRRDDEPVG
jgi:hypothetical protein